MTIQTKFPFDSHSQRISECREVVRNELRRTDVNICEVLKEKGLKKVLDNTKEEFKNRVLEEIVWVANKNKTFSMDDVREACKHLGNPHHSNFYGAVMNAASKLKICKKTGKYIKSNIPSNHGHLNAEWEKY